MADYKPTMFIIEFINGKLKKWDDDRFKLEIAEDGQSLKVYSRITQEVALDVPNINNVLYIHYNIVKKQQKQPFNPAMTEEEFNAASAEQDTSDEE